MAFSYIRTLTVTNSAVILPATQTNFPVLVSISDSTLKTVANLGHINNTGVAASGPAITMPYDLIFTSDSAGTVKIPWEIISYDGTNGVLWARVLVASCALSSVFYCLYGDASIVAAQNTGSFVPANVWDTNYKLVYHFSDGTTLNATDSSSSANNGTITSATATAGKIDGAAAFGGSAWIKTASNVLNPSTTDFTVSFWVNVTNFTAGSTFLSQLDGVGTGRNWLDVNITTGIIRTNLGNVNTNFTSTLSAGVTAHLTLTKTGTTVKLYKNGILDGTTVTATSESATGVTEIGATKLNATPLLGWIDGFNIANTLRSANWITAIYNTENAPNTFLTVGAEGPFTPTTGTQQKLGLFGFGS